MATKKFYLRFFLFLLLNFPVRDKKVNLKTCQSNFIIYIQFFFMWFIIFLSTCLNNLFSVDRTTYADIQIAGGKMEDLYSSDDSGDGKNSSYFRQNQIKLHLKLMFYKS